MTASNERPTPAQLAAAAAAELGPERFATWCAAIISGELGMDSLINNSDPDRRWLATGPWTNWGPPQTWAERGIDYWPRVWAARSLLHQWHPVAEGAIATGLRDEHWRVREMCAKVAAKHQLGSAADGCASLAESDPNDRVRIAALRAIAVIGEGEHASAIAANADHDDRAVRQVAEVARERLSARLERPWHDLLDG